MQSRSRSPSPINDFEDPTENSWLTGSESGSNDNLPLFDGEPRQGWSGRFWGQLKNGFHYLKDGIISGAKFVKKHPIAATIGPISSGTNALNALMGPSGDSPANLGKEWWENMDGGMQATSVSAGLSSAFINSMMNIFFFLTMRDKLRNVGVGLRQGGKAAVMNSTAILLGFGGALSAAAIGFNAYLWGTLGAAIPAGLLNGTMTFLSRMFGMLNLMNKASRARTKPVKHQKAFGSILALIDPRYQPWVEARIRHHLEVILRNRLEAGIEIVEWDAAAKLPITSEEYRELIRRLSQDLQAKYHLNNDLFMEKTWGQTATEWAKTGFDYGSGTLAFASAYLAFSYNGFKCVKIISTLVSGDTLSTMPRIAQAGIGFVSGAASGASYFDAGVNIRQILVNDFYYLRRNPRPTVILAAFLLVLMAGLSSVGNATIARGIMNDKDNYIGLEHGQTLSLLFTITFILYGAVSNWRPISGFVNSAAPSPAQIDLNYVVTRSLAADDDFERPVDNEELAQSAKATKDAMKAVSRLGLFHRDADLEDGLPSTSVQEGNMSLFQSPQTL